MASLALTWTVRVRVRSLVRLVADVRDVDGDAAGALLGGLVDLRVVDEPAGGRLAYLTVKQEAS